MAQPNTESNDDADSALKASVFQRLHPRVYLERFLAEKVRPDGRDPTAFREIGVNVGEPFSFTTILDGN
jgi:exosome complex component RRP43